MGAVTSIDPRSARAVEVVAQETTPAELADICKRAAEVLPQLSRLEPATRADLLDAIASTLEAQRDELVALADRESALGVPRLDGELTRTTNQLRLFGSVLRDGSFLEAIIDHEAGLLPDLRRMLIPIGPVAVFGASNFPFAFSAAGGDTASALAAGCPVVVKAHGAHPALDAAVTAIMRGAAVDFGVSEDVIAVVFGREAARLIVQDPRIQAVGFTGSERVGRMLMDLAAARTRPVPVYAEMGSLNPLIVSDGAVERPGLADTIADSVLLGAGQFCTKPGLVFVPDGKEGDRLTEAIEERLSGSEAAFLLTTDIRDAFVVNSNLVANAQGARQRVAPEVGDGSSVTAALAEVAAGDVENDRVLMTESFGPGTLVVRYSGVDELLDALAAVPAALTMSLFAEPEENLIATAVLEKAELQTGRVIFDGVPTGVAVSWAQNHAGPYPASANGMFTSVGATAVRRFQRPLAYQTVPDAALPPALQEANPLRIPRRVDGFLQSVS